MINFLKGDKSAEMTNQEILNGDGGEWEILTEEELKIIIGGVQISCAKAGGDRPLLECLNQCTSVLGSTAVTVTNCSLSTDGSFSCECGLGGGL